MQTRVAFVIYSIYHTAFITIMIIMSSLRSAARPLRLYYIRTVVLRLCFFLS